MSDAVMEASKTSAAVSSLAAFFQNLPNRPRNRCIEADRHPGGHLGGKGREISSQIHNEVKQTQADRVNQAELKQRRYQKSRQTDRQSDRQSDSQRWGQVLSQPTSLSLA